MEQLLLQSIANDGILALHDKAVAGSPDKLQLSAPAHTKLLKGSNLALAHRQHPEVTFLRRYRFYWALTTSEGVNTCGTLQQVYNTPMLLPLRFVCT